MDTRFKKGQIPWNKDKKGVMPTPWNKATYIKKICKCGKEFSVRPSWDYVKSCSTSCARKGQRMGEDNTNWKGDKVSYGGIHAWIRRNLGKADYCSFDITHEAINFNWANVSGSYLRDKNDWIQLCPTCHKQYDTIIPKRAINTFMKFNNRFTERKVL